MEDTTLQGKSIVVTGAGSGIGRAAALQAAARGARVTVADRDVAAGQQVADRITAEGGAAQFIEVDIAREDQVRVMVDSAVSAYGSLDGAFNNAGISAYSHRPGNPTTQFADLTAEIVRGSVDVNVMGTFLCMKYEIVQMLLQGGGSIVNTASDAGILATFAAADYVACKHAVIGLTKAAALDYATDRIRVNAVLPGVTRTKMMEESFADNPDLIDWAAGIQPVKRIAEPAEIAEGALWLLSGAASFVTGISLPVDGGYSMV